ncbi:hypothetical protein GGQ74_001164 [Desulfobaculum xiamenense]|uniref:Uncharacterized protein n=1 Tax=Desulfobaculum xiamenense TaxID=995050 RepID=A0A846QQP0_9BACT|nr:hypothetical protein [Desulfobaculum xiamenense]NJB67524.1 hypothetical protein [Desulfobaculum xiamenense]
MTRQDFAEFVKSLCRYFGRPFDIESEAGRDQLKLWYRHVAEIPAEPLGWIEARIQQGQDFFPRNLPRNVRQLWDEWLREHPERVASRREEVGRSCGECLGGLLYVQRPLVGRDGIYRPYIGPDGREYERIQTAVFRCATCNGAPVSIIPMATASQLQAQGWEFQGSMPQWRGEGPLRTPETVGSLPWNR